MHAPEVVAELAELEPTMTEMRESAEEILRHAAGRLWQRDLFGGTNDQAVGRRRGFPAAMEKIVALIKRAAQRRILYLRAGMIAITGLALGIAASVYWGVIQPAARTIRHQQTR